MPADMITPVITIVAVVLAWDNRCSNQLARSRTSQGIHYIIRAERRTELFTLRGKQLMQNSSEGQPSLGRRRVVGRVIKRVGPILLILFWLLTIVVGIVVLASGLVGRQEAASLAVAPVCVSGQVAGCRLDEQVTVVDLNTYSPARGPTTRFVEVQTPDGSTQNVQDHEGDLFPLLYIDEELNAELWKGTVIKLDDGAGHNLIADDSPVVTGAVLPVTGSFFIIAGAILLAVTVWSLVRQGRAIR